MNPDTFPPEKREGRSEISEGALFNARQAAIAASSSLGGTLQDLETIDRGLLKSRLEGLERQLDIIKSNIKAETK